MCTRVELYATMVVVAFCPPSATKTLGAGRAAGDLARAHYELRAFVSSEGKKEKGGLEVAAGGFEPATPI